MGASFSSNRLDGAVSYGDPSISYAYSTANTASFGVDAYYSYLFYGQPTTPPIGLITPFLQGGDLTNTVTCTPFQIEATSQSLKCPIAVTSLNPALYTISFSQYISTSSGSFIVQSTGSTENTLTQYNGHVTFSIVDPTPVITPTLTATTTITSGVFDVSPTSTATVPQTTVYVTIYGTTIVSTSTSLATTSSASALTVTGTCPPKSSSTLTKCDANNCLRNLRNDRYSSSASAFCSTYTQSLNTDPSAIPTILKNCQSNPSRVSSACSCLVAPTSAQFSARGVVENVYSPPDFTYSEGPVEAITVTQTSGPVPSSTFTEPNPTVSAGTSSITSSITSTVTVTIFKSTQISINVSTVTVAPTNCA